MREFLQNFSAHIEGEATTLCWIWKLIRKDGRVLGFTDHDLDLNIDGVIYQAQSGFSAGDIENKLGFSLDNSAFAGAFSSDAISEDDIYAGVYDGARVEISRVNWQNTDEYGLIWSGLLGEITLIDGRFEAELVGLASLLDRSTGRVFSRQCQADFGGVECGVDLDSFPAGTLCPHTFEACSSQFQNTVNFRGFPYLIGEDEAINAPREADLKDGSSRYG